MLDIPCVILAGGKSSRMQSDKALMMFKANKSLCEYQVERLSGIFKNVYVSAKSDKFGFDVELIEDESQIYSPMIALEKVLSCFKKKVFILSVDMPFVGEQEIKKMYAFTDDHDIIIAQTHQKKHYLCGFFDSSLKYLCEELLKNDIHKIAALVSASNTKYVDFVDDEIFANLNYLEEYKKAIL